VLATRAAELGHEVVALDDLSRGLNAPWAAEGATARPEARDWIRFRRHDCQGGIAEAVAAVVGRAWGPDAVVHLAAATNPGRRDAYRTSEPMDLPPVVLSRHRRARRLPGATVTTSSTPNNAVEQPVGSHALAATGQHPR